MKIEKNIPIPERGWKRKYPFGNMDIGDSFLVDADGSNKAISAAKMYGMRHGLKFTSKKQDDGCARIWRIE